MLFYSSAYIRYLLTLRMAVICSVCRNTINSRRPAIFCCTCKKQFHSNCISSGIDLSSVLNEIRGLSWQCEDCVNTYICVNEEDIKTIIENQLQVAVSDLKSKFETFTSDFERAVESKIQSILPKQSSVSVATPDKPNYAQIVRNKAHPGVLIKPKDQKQESSKTKTDMMKKISPADSNIQLSRLRAVGGGGLLLGCRNSEDNKKLKDIVQQKMSDSYEVVEMHGLNPRIRIAGITGKYDDQKLLETIKKCNRGVFTDTSSCSLIKFCSTKKNPNTFQATLQVDKCTYENAVAFGYLFVDFDCCKVFDAIEVLRCFKCNEFHHSSKFCKNSVSCPRCGQGHMVNECHSDSLTCINCVKLNDKIDGSIDTNHAAWDTPNCTSYKQACGRLRSDVLAAQ